MKIINSYQYIMSLAERYGVSMIDALNGWCDHAHINEGIKKPASCRPKKYKQDDKRLITEAS